MSLLGKRFPLGDVDDVEALCRSAIERSIRTHPGMFVTDVDYDDLVAELIAFVWEIWNDGYDPAHGIAFASYASWRLRFAVIEHYRRRFGRNGQRRPPPGSCHLSELDLDQLDAALSPGEGDGALDRALARGWLEPQGDRSALLADMWQVAEEACTPKGVGRLLDQLRAEIRQQAA